MEWTPERHERELEKIPERDYRPRFIRDPDGVWHIVGRVPPERCWPGWLLVAITVAAAGLTRLL
jgi:hypothetical protein